MEESSQAPGFFGKLRTHGDFVSRRLPPAVRDCFDHWLQGALLQSRSDLGEAWLPTWLSSPLWRFVVGAGVCGEQTWAGVMMPSHDRVGRCYPLLIASPIDGTPSLRACLTLHDGWFERLEDLALSTLEEEFTLDEFDAGLLSLSGAPRAAGSGIAPSVSASAVAGPLADLAATILTDESFEGRSAWWSLGSPQLAPALAACPGLPAPRAFSALLNGGWDECGWRAF